MLVPIPSVCLSKLPLSGGFGGDAVCAVSQERELKTFRESAKQELRLLKQETDMLPRERRKEALRSQKDKLDQQHQVTLPASLRQWWLPVS